MAGTKMKKAKGVSFARLDWDLKAPEMWKALNHGRGDDEVVQVGSITGDKDKPHRFYDGNPKSWAPDIHKGTEPSTLVAAIDYDSKTLELKITFRDGTTCLYSDIPNDMALDFSNAPSKGRWVHENLWNRDYLVV